MSRYLAWHLGLSRIMARRMKAMAVPASAMAGRRETALHQIRLLQNIRFVGASGAKQSRHKLAVVCATLMPQAFHPWLLD
jgi:hypothetical protein